MSNNKPRKHKKSRLSLGAIALHDVVGQSVMVDEITIIPAFYKIMLPDYKASHGYSLAEYMDHNGYDLRRTCPEFHAFTCSPENEVWQNHNELWVRARIIDVYNFYPPSALGWRSELLNIPFLAVLYDENNDGFSLHPFTCISHIDICGVALEFFDITPVEEHKIIANSFWKTLVKSKGLGSYIDQASIDEDGHGPCDYVGGYWNNEFHAGYSESSGF